MSIVSKKLQLLRPSATLAAARRAWELQNQGKDVISLVLGEPDYPTPEYVKQAAIEAINNNYTRYTEVSGVLALKEAVMGKFKRENNLDYAPNEIIISAGAKQVIFNLLAVTLDPGDEVIIPAPYWVSYLDAILYNEGSPIILRSDSNFKISPQALREAITSKTKWLILNSPSNPTGAIYSSTELQALAQVLLQYPHVHILSDDIYEHIIFDEAKCYNIAAVAPELKSRVFTINGASKAYSMTGWRIGYGAGDTRIIAAMSNLQSQSTSNPCSISQMAALAAVSRDNTELFSLQNQQLKAKRDIVFNTLKSVKALQIDNPQGSFYIFPSCASAIGKTTPAGRLISSGQDFVVSLLEEALVAVTPGGAFGADDYFRISYAASIHAASEGAKRIANFCNDLKD